MILLLVLLEETVLKKERTQESGNSKKRETRSNKGIEGEEADREAPYYYKYGNMRNYKHLLK